MRLRTVMLVLALLFVPVMADAGNPREAEFSPPANEGVAIAAAAASLVGWLYVASAGGNPEKRRRVDVAGTMGQYFNHLPQDRPSNAARAAAGARLAVAPDFPLNGSGSATSGSAVSASVSTTVPHPTSAPAHAASHDSGSGTSVAPTPSHVAPRYVVGAQWGYKNLCTGEMEKVTIVGLQPPSPDHNDTDLTVLRPDGRSRDTQGSRLTPLPPAARVSLAAAQSSPVETPATPSSTISPAANDPSIASSATDASQRERTGNTSAR